EDASRGPTLVSGSRKPAALEVIVIHPPAGETGGNAKLPVNTAPASRTRVSPPTAESRAACRSSPALSRRIEGALSTAMAAVPAPAAGRPRAGVGSWVRPRVVSNGPVPQMDGTEAVISTTTKTILIKRALGLNSPPVIATPLTKRPPGSRLEASRQADECL